VKSAVELFTFERRSSRFSMVEQTWQTRSEPEESFISVAVSHWEMARGTTTAPAEREPRCPGFAAAPGTELADGPFTSGRCGVGSHVHNVSAEAPCVKLHQGASAETRSHAARGTKRHRRPAGGEATMA
jgi:hypothetical protein